MKNLNKESIEKNIDGLSIEDAYKYLLEVQQLNKKKYLDDLIKKYYRLKESVIKEEERVKRLYRYEKEIRAKGYAIIAGIDEAGRGPLAGPVAAACVILPEELFIDKLNDSKKLTEHQRELIYEQVTQKAISWSVVMIDNNIIDNINILNATKLAMKRTIEKLSIKPDFILIDAITLTDVEIKQLSIIKGDSLSASIAAASVIAKVTRDRYMKSMEEIYPGYGFSEHKGYGTSYHIEAIKKNGVCPIHRMSFLNNICV